MGTGFAAGQGRRSMNRRRRKALRLVVADVRGGNDTPDRAVAVLGNQKRAVPRDGDSDGPPPDLPVVDDEAGDEVLIFAGRNSVPEPDTDHLVAGSLRPVPGAMLGGE